jgi:cysteinyl-tRNA synthetase
MGLRIYDTLTASKRPFEPVTPGKAGMYVCGMTVQDRPHVGHIRASLSGDLMRRYLQYLGYDVTYVYNFTDVDDKIIERAQKEGLEYAAVSERNIDAYLRFADFYNIQRATVYPRATQHIPEILDLIRRLIDQGVAYAAAGDVYFEVRKKPDYGKLSKRNVDDMRSGARIEVGEHKRDPLDFVLWKGAKPGEPAWDTPWGPGRPGWHIECSAMSMKYLGEHFDIHGGGQDLIFPHHENEIAQSESATGKPFANFWTENGMVNLSGDKMSKSTGVLLYAEDIAARFDPEVVRYYLLSTHYRSPIEFSEERLQEAGVGYQRLRAPLERAGVWSAARSSADLVGPLRKAADEAETRFHESMEDDFNSAKALGHLFDLARELNRAFDEGLDLEAGRAAARLHRLGQLLGLFWKPPAAAAEWPAEVAALVAVREEARKSKDWKRADEVRAKLLELGAVVEDGADGPRLKRKGQTQNSG